MLARIADASIASDDLSPLEATARGWRESAISDLGGREHLTTAKLSLVNTALGSWLLLSTVDTYLFELASKGGVVNRKHRRAFHIVEQRVRLADSLVRQLQALGLEKQNALPGGINVERAVVLLPDNGRDQLPSGGTTNGQYPSHRSPESESPKEIASVELPPRDDVISPNGDHHGDDDIERDLGLR